MKNNKQLLIPLILNIVLVVLAAVGAPMNIRNHGSVAASIVYYTQDSNVFLGVSALIYIAALVRCLKHPGCRIPDWVQRLKYFAVCCIAVTLFVVLFILAPMASSLGGLRWILFTDSMLYQHLLSPVIAIGGFLLFEKEPPMPFRVTVFALIPTLLYAAVLYPLNIAGIVDGPYPFLQVQNMSPGRAVMWFFILLVLSYALALLVWFLNRKIAVFKERTRV